MKPLVVFEKAKNNKSYAVENRIVNAFTVIISTVHIFTKKS